MGCTEKSNAPTFDIGLCRAKDYSNAFNKRLIEAVDCIS
jgi:hypothetical protein